MNISLSVNKINVYQTAEDDTGTFCYFTADFYPYNV